jgi:hypothetical protein
LGVFVGSFDELPLVKVAPARTSATRWGALTARQRVWAASMSVNAMANPAAREPGPLGVLAVVPHGRDVLSIGFVTDMKGHGAASPRRSPGPPGGSGWVGLQCDRPGQGRRE